MAGINCPLIIAPGSSPAAKALSTSFKILPLFPFNTQSNTGSKVPAEAALSVAGASFCARWFIRLI